MEDFFLLKGFFMLLKGNKQVLLNLLREVYGTEDVTLAVTVGSHVKVYVTRDGVIHVSAPAMADVDTIHEVAKKSRDGTLRAVEKVRKESLEMQKKISEQNEGDGKVQSGRASARLSRDDINELYRQAGDFMPPLVEKYAGMIGCGCNHITLKLLKSKWGSCSELKNINLNVLIMLLPEELRHTVIVHEVCHLRYLNHQAEFYRLCCTLQSDYMENQKKVKELAGEIFRRAFGS